MTIRRSGIVVGMMVATMCVSTSRSAADWRYAAPTVTVDGPVTVADGAGNGYTDSTSTDDIEALRSRAVSAPDEAGPWFRLAQAYAAGDKPGQALEACARAAALKPGNIEIRRHCSHYAEWSGDLPASIEHFEKLLDLAPGDDEALLGAARARSWSANLRRSANYYRRYLDIRPDDPDAWIEYARVRAWQGNFAVALKVLEEYRDRFGDSELYREEKARFLAWDNRPRESLSIIAPLLREEPEDYERLYTRAVAQAIDHRTDEALEIIESLKRLRPDSRDTQLLERTVRTPTRSTVSAGWHYYDDSDNVKIQGGRFDARLRLTPEASLTAGVTWDHLHADTGSGFETIEDEQRIRYSSAWVGGAYRFNPVVAVSGRIGRTDIDTTGDLTPYEVGLDLRPVDEVELSLLRRRELYALSPRSVSLGIEREHNALTVNWRPGYRYTVESILSYDELSDGNTRKELVLAPRRTMLRTGAYNMDLGGHFNWMAFEDDIDNGYYDPERYRRYAASFFGYHKLSEERGLSVVATAGFHKDDEMNDFEFGYDVVGELTLGLYGDWMSVLRVDYSDRYQQFSSYDGWNARLEITRRF